MMSMEGAKIPLCKFINNCREFKQTKKCKFSHDRCRFQQKCNDKFNCKFYHPQIQNQIQARSLSKPASKSKVADVACIFGKNCQKKKIGKCFFNHDIQPSPGQKKFQNPRPTGSKLNSGPKQCKFGAKCNKFPMGLCPFLHVQSSTVNNEKNGMKKQMSLQQNNPNQESNKNEQIQDNIFYNNQLQQFEASKICQNFAMGACKFADCSKAHQLTFDNSLKRLFIRKYNVIDNFQIKMFKINETRIFAIGKGKSIGFYELDEEFEVLKTICNSEMDSQGQINYLQILRNKEAPMTIISTTTSNKLYKLNPITGAVQEKHYPNSNNITGMVSFTKQNLSFIGNRVSGLIIQNNGQKNAEIIRKHGDKLNKICFLKEFEMLGQNFICYGTENGNISLMNKNLEVSSINIPNSVLIDVCAAKHNSKPYAFVVAYQNQREYTIIAINLLDLAWNVVLTYSSSRISKVCVVHDRIFVGIDNNGVIVYLLPDFRKIKGRIPVKGKIHNLEGDSDGNLLLHEITPTNSIVSIYKVRK